VIFEHNRWYWKRRHCGNLYRNPEVHTHILSLILQLLFTKRGFFDQRYFYETSHDEESIPNILRSHLAANTARLRDLFFSLTEDDFNTGRATTTSSGGPGPHTTTGGVSNSSIGGLRLMKLLFGGTEEGLGTNEQIDLFAASKIVAPEQRYSSDFAEGAEAMAQSTGQFSELFFFSNPFLDVEQVLASCCSS
ncbi:unnamed protein product, partial [Amoebophrya sp. A25]